MKTFAPTSTKIMCCCDEVKHRLGIYTIILYTEVIDKVEEFNIDGNVCDHVGEFY